MNKTQKHIKACQAYKKAYASKHGWLQCEHCGATRPFRFDVHHIYSTGRYPNHPEIDKPRNLYLVCNICHDGFHLRIKSRVDEFKAAFVKLEKDRSLKKLFGVEQ